MTEKIDHAAIDALASCYQNKGLEITVLADNPVFQCESLRKFRLATKNDDRTAELIMTVFDEFRDADCPYPVLWLNLILVACAGFEESKNFTDWCLNEGFGNSAFYKSIYQEYSRQVPGVRKIVGASIKPLDSFHFELNTETAKTLQALRL